MYNYNGYGIIKYMRKSYWKTCLMLVFVLICSFLSLKNVSAETNDNGCNNGDIVTIKYAQKKTGAKAKTTTLEVGGKATVGKNFTVAVKCEGDKYKFSTIKIKHNKKTYTADTGSANAVSVSEMSDDGSATVSDGTSSVTYAKFGNGIEDYAFWMSGVEQKEDTTNPSTGTADNAFDPSKSDEENVANGTAEETDDALDIVDGGEAEGCKNARGAETLGWIVCPVLTWLGDVSDTIYTEYVEPGLQVDPELFSGGNEAVKQAWEIFRDISNVLFIILLLVVIFSQVTGVGIDNYGIKKVLPRIIIAAILINLSYVLCLLFVDISNILGNGFRGLFDSFSQQLGDITVQALEDSEFVVDGAHTTSYDISSVLAGLGLFAAAVTMVGAVMANPAILLSLVIAGFGIVVAILFLFFLLAARKAAVIVLVVLSPLAVAAYMLPNTKRFFDRWLKLFEGMLLVYPITGLLVGAGDYISRLMLSTSDGFFTWMTAMIVGVVPIFFIPMVLKSAFSAMGKVGGMLAGMGSAARGRATGTMRNSESYKNATRMGLERRNRIKAGLDKNGNLTASAERRLKRLGRLRGVPLVGGVANGMIKGQAAKIAQAKKDMGASEAAVAQTTGALARKGIGLAKALPGSGEGGALGSAFGWECIIETRSDISLPSVCGEGECPPS